MSLRPQARPSPTRGGRLLRRDLLVGAARHDPATLHVSLTMRKNSPSAGSSGRGMSPRRAVSACQRAAHPCSVRALRHNPCMKREVIGRSILRGVAGMALIGGYAMDWNRTHLFNPSWPPHAKFHDAMTIVLGSFLGGASLYMLRRSPGRDAKRLRTAALLPAAFFGAQALAFAFPNTGGLDAEFPELIPRVGRVTLNELPFASLVLSLSLLGFVLAAPRAELQQPLWRRLAPRATSPRPS
jgi:hypothetical protein